MSSIRVPNELPYEPISRKGKPEPNEQIIQSKIKARQYESKMIAFLALLDHRVNQ